MEQRNLDALQRAQHLNIVMLSYEELTMLGWAFEVHDDMHFTQSTVPRWRVLVKRRNVEDSTTMYFNELIGRGADMIPAMEEAIRNTLRFEQDVRESPL